MMGLFTCKVCGREFTLAAINHYTARDSEKTGIVVAFSGQSEATLWDAFNCPYCGCQCIIQERKRVYNADEHHIHDETARLNGCYNCKYKDVAENETPCVSCEHNCTDNWEEEEENE